MKIIQAKSRSKKFDVLASTDVLQAAMMMLRGNDASDNEPSNEHPICEQWLFVIAGSGSASIIPKRGRRRTAALKPGTLLIIEDGELHQIRHSGRGALRTINFYSPPAYKSDGSLRPFIQK